MKEYFIACELFYKNTSRYNYINKFFSSIVSADLHEQRPFDIAKDLARRSFPELPIDEAIIKITAFNNIER